MTSRVGLVALLCAAACSSGSGSQKLDMRRVEAGELHLDRVQLPDGRTMLHGVAVLDSPPERVFNVFHDIEAWPEWNSRARSARVLARDRDTVDMEITFSLLPGRPAEAVQQRVRFDRDRGEITMTMYENTWARNVISTVKLEPYGDGSRTLFNAYTVGEFKSWWAKAAQSQQHRALAMLVNDIRAAARRPRYATARPVDVGAAEGAPKVLVPGFRSTSLPADTVQTLTRVFAQHLMREARWNVLTEEEMVALLEHAKQRELAGCAPTDPCAVDLGRAMEAERVVHGTVGKVGDTYVLSVAVLKLPEGVVERRVEEEARTDAELLARVRQAAGKLAGK